MAQSGQNGAISFRYLAEIAVGATARVDLCRADDGRLLAVKRLHPHIAEDPGFATQFLDEVWMTASLKHPNVVEVAGWGTDEQGSYLAVELVQGVSLSRLMKTVFDTGEQFTERMVVYVCGKLCAGLAAAHALTSPEGELLQLVHRDLTPGNVLVGFDGDVKIADFGLAKAKLRLTKTITGLLKGQPTYMAPEQAKALEIDSRADVFSLGVVLFELFAARRPWLGSSDYEMMQKTANDPPADLRELRPKIDKELVAVVNKCLEKSPDDRFQTAGEVQARLDAWLNVHGYMEGSQEAVARFVRRNAMRQMRWFERAIAGDMQPQPTVRVGRAPRQASSANITDRAALVGTASHAVGRSIPVEPLSLRPPPPPNDPRLMAGGYPVPRIEDDETDVSDAAIRASHVNARLRETASDGESDWGEEVPTLVQKDGSPVVRRGAGLPNIADDESDLRTTSVKNTVVRLPSGPLPAAGRAPEQLPVIADMDSGEAPTGQVAPEDRAAAMRARPGASGIPQAPIARGFAPKPAAGRPATAPPPPPIAARSGPSAPPREGYPRPSSDTGRSAAWSNGQGALARSAVEAVRAAVNAATAEHQRLTAADATPEPHQPEPRHDRPDPDAPAVREASPRRPSDRPPSLELVVAEADRLAIEAVRLGEEAKTAQLRADKKASQARAAGEAAAIAAEAVRMAQSSGLGAAMARLEDARRAEVGITSAVSSIDHRPAPIDHPDRRGAPIDHPDRRGAPIDHPDRRGAPIDHPDRRGALDHPDRRHSPAPSQDYGHGYQQGTPMPQYMGGPPRRSAPPPAPPPPQGGHSNLGGEGGYAPQSVNPPPPGAASGSFHAGSPFTYPGGQGIVTGENRAFASRLRPTLFGMSGAVVGALAVAAFGLVFVVLWLIFG